MGIAALVGLIGAIIVGIGGLAAIVGVVILWGRQQATDAQQRSLESSLTAMATANAELRSENTDQRQRADDKISVLQRKIEEERVACSREIGQLQGQITALTGSLAEQIVAAAAAAAARVADAASAAAAGVLATAAHTTTVTTTTGIPTKEGT